MELAILGGLALVGWSLSPGGVSRRVQHTPSVHVTETAEYPFDPDTAHQELLQTDERRIKRHVYDAKKVLQEYAKSDKTAAVDTQRKMELFTGADNVQWKKKADVTRLFDPTETSVAVSSGGKAMSMKSYDPNVLLDREVFGSTMNNALPFAQERVGPGLGVDASVPSTDGLHSQFRVLPTHTLNAYRTNQLPGRSSSGAAAVASGSRRFDTFTQTQPSLVNHTPNPGPGRTSFQAQTVLDRRTFYPSIVQKHTRSEGFKPFPRTMGGCVTTCGAPVHSAFTRENDKREQQAGMAGGAATQFEMYEASGHNIRDPKAGSLYMSTGQTMRGRGYTISSGTVSSASMTASNQREEETIQGVGGASYLKGPSTRSHFRRSRKDCSAGRVQHGALQGGVAVDTKTMGENHIRKTKKNAYERAAMGRAPYAQQRQSGGFQTSSKKVSSSNPHGEWDSLGLGLVDVRDT